MSASTEAQRPTLLRRLTRSDALNFFLTNRLPRASLTRLMGRFSKIKSPRLTRLSIAIWRLFTDLDLSEAEQSHFESLHACFTRRLKPGARVVDQDPDVMVSPCDAFVVACGTIHDGLLIQAKDQRYRLEELLAQTGQGGQFQSGTYVTLRLTSAMYHRFHAPADGSVTHVRYIAGDVWNVNPPALARVPRLYCRNERAVIQMQLEDGTPFMLVPVAAILVASIRLHFLDVLLHLKYPGPNDIACQAKVSRGEELGWFEHGSTIVAIFPPGFELASGINLGARIQMGQALLRRVPDETSRPVVE